VERLEKHAADLDRMYGSDAVKLDASSSVYEGHGAKSVGELLSAVKEVLK
jgi:hypothetical protein